MGASRVKSGAILVSACLLGRPCRFDGKDKFTPELAFLLEGRKVIAVCPEELGGLDTPRPACQIEGGDGADVLDAKACVIGEDGVDRTQAFLSGAQAALARAVEGGAREAILKERSPSCGVTRVYRDGALGRGQGVCTALLARYGIRVIDEVRALRRKKGRPLP
jgi:uncharacterized protein YbbK (DUF523 family)